jgi:hypothetical protein
MLACEGGGERRLAMAVQLLKRLCTVAEAGILGEDDRRHF